jgi:hypothetical protein
MMLSDQAILALVSKTVQDQPGHLSRFQNEDAVA